MSWQTRQDPGWGLGLLPSEVTLILCIRSCVYMHVCICMCVYVCVCTHSSSLAWRIPWTVKPGWRGGYSSWGLTELDTIEAT